MIKKNIILLCLVTFMACTKENNNHQDTVSNSIYGKYSSDIRIDTWEDFLGLLLGAGTLITVSPGSGDYIHIEVLEWSGSYTFDSVKLAVDNSSFTVDQMIVDSTSASGFSHATGEGAFGTRSITYDLFVDRDSASYDSNVSIVNAKKTSD